MEGFRHDNTEDHGVYLLSEITVIFCVVVSKSLHKALTSALWAVCRFPLSALLSFLWSWLPQYTPYPALMPPITFTHPPSVYTVVVCSCVILFELT